MAPRYRVGTGGNWNSTTYWSTSSGGGGGASVPGSADDGIFDASTPVGTVTIDVAVDIVNLTCTGWTGTLDQAGYTMQVSGNWLVPTGMTFTHNGLVQMDGTGTQQLTMAAASNKFDDIQNSNTSGNDVNLGADLRVAGVLTIDAGATIDTAATYDVYLEGNGTPLVLNGIFYGNSSVLYYEVQTGGTTYITGSTGWNINGGLTGMSVLVQIIATVTATIRLSADIRDVNSFTIESTTAGASATATFYTDNYDIKKTDGTGEGVYSFIRIGPELAADACAFTSYWGSSIIRWSVFIRWQWDAATHNLQSAHFHGKDDADTYYSVYGTTTDAVDTAQTWVPGTSTIQCRYTGESWMGLGSHDGIAECYDMIFDRPGNVCYAYIKTIATNKMSATNNGSSAQSSVECQAIVDFGELELRSPYAVTTFELYEVGISDVDTLDLLGNATYDVQIRSRVPATQAELALVNPATVSYVDVQDSNLTSEHVNAWNGTNTDSGNNSSNWHFTEPGAATAAYSYRRRRT
jgi:hypothetical protein